MSSEPIEANGLKSESSPANGSIDFKGIARDERLSSRRNNSAEQLRKELVEAAKVKCKPYFEQFAYCAKKEGYFVMFKCRVPNEALNDCLNHYFNDQELEKYLAQHNVKPEPKKSWFFELLEGKKQI